MRERSGDLPLLIDHFMGQIDPQKKRPISAGIMDRLMRHHWPGNVRELQNALRQYVALGKLDLAAAGPPRNTGRFPSVDAPFSAPDGDLQDMVRVYEKRSSPWPCNATNGTAPKRRKAWASTAGRFSKK